MIEVAHLSKRFGAFTAVDDVSFRVDDGEIFGLLGPNGAGKSTTIRMLIGLLHPSAGRALISGFDCWRDRQRVHRLIGVAFEQPTLYERLSVWENLRLFARLHSVSHTRLQDVMARLSLEDMRHKLAGNLSKGWKQRVIIARALLHQPRILFLDEPTSGLDPNSALMLHGIVKELRQNGVTIVLCTHDMHEADALCDRIGIMYQGQMRALDTPQKLKATGQQSELVITYRRDGQLLTATYALDDPEAGTFIQQQILDHALVSITTRQTNLADVFASITGGALS
jgi:ABC-2 type transport system ATP-binding protein